MIDDESFLHDKVFMLKTIFCKNSYIFLKNVRIGNIFVVSPNTSMQISRNKGATKKSSR